MRSLIISVSMPIFRRNSTLSKHYKAIMHGNFSSINKSNVNVPDQYGNTMLHLASKKGNLQLVTHLIQLGANTRSANKKAQTPLDIVNNKILKNQEAHNEYTKIAQLLIEYDDENNNIVHLVGGKLVLLDHNKTGQYTAAIQVSAIPSQAMKNTGHIVAHNMKSEDKPPLPPKLKNLSNKDKPPLPPKLKNLIDKDLLLQDKDITESKIDSKVQSIYNEPWNENDEWNKVDLIIAEYMAFFNNEDASLLGTDSFAQ